MNSWKPRVLPGRPLILQRSHLWVAVTLTAYFPLTSFAGASAMDANPIVDGGFDDQMLMKAPGQRINVARYERGNPVPPGNYTIDLYVNGDWVAHADARFDVPPGGDSAMACFDRALIERIGLDKTALSDVGHAEMVKVMTGGCADLARLVEGAKQSFEMSDFRLDLSIPQIALMRNPRGYVNPELWDEGVTSATLGYYANTYHYSNHGMSSDQGYLGLNGGVNIGSWHLRSDGAFNWQSGERRTYQNIATYLQHDIPSLRSQLTIGESFTDGAVFDSIGIRGVQLTTDDRMLPDSLRGYAPVIRGVAMTNARVTVTQNGNRLFETTVAPGQFEINDLYATGYGGSLEVTITEADGSRRSFTVPYASVVQLLRPGIWRMNLVAGQVRDAQLDSHNNIVQATAQRGINNAVTGYIGITAAANYSAQLAGAAFNTPVGAVAVDLTQAYAQIPGARHTNGQSLRVSYSKLLADTNSNISVAAYRYSTSGFWSLRDTLLARQLVGYDTTAAFLAAGASSYATDNYDRQRSQLQITFNQALGQRGGNAYVVGSVLDYWNRSGTTVQFQVGYNNSLHIGGLSLHYNVSLSRQRDAYTGRLTNQSFASLSLPLGKSQHAPLLSMSASHVDGTGATQQANLSGSAGVDNQFSYGVSAGHSPGYSSGGANAQYRSPFATMSASASSGTGYSQQSAGLSGAIVAHPGGVTLANDLGETMAVVEAKDAAGARIENWPGVRIDGRGYAVIPYLTPYRFNTVGIDPKGIPLDVDMTTTGQEIAPRANSVVMVRFATTMGRSAIFSVHRQDGSAPPFGADVLDEKGNTVSAVGQGGHIYLPGLSDEGTFTIKWGTDQKNRCAFHYHLPPKNKSGIYDTLDATCYDLSDASVAASVQMRGTLVNHVTPETSGTATDSPAITGNVASDQTKRMSTH